FGFNIIGLLLQGIIRPSNKNPSQNSFSYYLSFFLCIHLLKVSPILSKNTLSNKWKTISKTRCYNYLYKDINEYIRSYA
ncbi:MAG TPA: hypothetical protein VE595_04570, partial [Nitrososphaeraceae archaeon]|nr:hypothetical protein [Nitrososphaeraceae archaeon]